MGSAVCVGKVVLFEGFGPLVGLGTAECALLVALGTAECAVCVGKVVLLVGLGTAECALLVALGTAEYALLVGLGARLGLAVALDLGDVG